MSQPQFSAEELRALEAEMEKLTVDDVLLQTLVTLINLGARKAGLGGPPSQPTQEQPKRDLEQTRMAIDGARALMPLLEGRHAQQLGPVREALSQLQMAFVRLSGEGAPPSEPEKPKEERPGPAQSSGRLWVPGQ